MPKSSELTAVTPTPSEIERFIHEHIPLSRTIQVSVVSIADDIVVLEAPLAPNINHRGTVFGGSASALAILAAWSLLYAHLKAEDATTALAIQRNAMEYLEPVRGAFQACATLREDADWSAFKRMHARRGKLRIAIMAQLKCDGRIVGRFSGDFVALNAE